MSTTHHNLDPYPIPKEKDPLYINEPWLIDFSLLDYADVSKEPEEQPDNIRVYVPLDINKAAVIRRLYDCIRRYGEANEDNEINFSIDVGLLVSQIEIYDQIHRIRRLPAEGNHSEEAKALVRDFISVLEEIPDGCAEVFPFELIDELRAEYEDL